MKRSWGYIILVVIVLAGLVYYLIPGTQYKRYKEFESPDKTRKLIVYVEKRNADLSFRSETDYKKAYVVLADKDDRVLAKPGRFSGCRFLLGDLQIDWDDSSKKIYYTKFDFIDLSDMTLHCN